MSISYSVRAAPTSYSGAVTTVPVAERRAQRGVAGQLAGPGPAGLDHCHQPELVRRGRGAPLSPCLFLSPDKENWWIWFWGLYSFKLEVTCPSRGSRAGDEGVQVVAVVSLLAVVARVTGKLEITANSEARRLPDCGPGRDEGVDAVILGGGEDGQRRPHSSTNFIYTQFQSNNHSF